MYGRLIGRIVRPMIELYRRFGNEFPIHNEPDS
jgi:hypothetical protein